ncbi:hypothetical protein [Paenibacillus sp. 1A_MP2]
MEVSNISGYIIRAIEENYADALRVFDPEDDDDIQTSIRMLNDRIGRYIVFHDQCIKEGMETEQDGIRGMLTKIMQEINKASEQRLLHNKRPLVIEDFYHHRAKEAFTFLAVQNNSQLQLELS